MEALENARAYVHRLEWTLLLTIFTQSHKNNLLHHAISWKLTT
jgi:hypothetical protein